MKRSFELLALAAGLSTVVVVPAAHAMSSEIGTDAAYCQYPTAVRLPLCTGIYMGSGLVLTAAHCIDNVNPGVSLARFGEHEGAWQYESVIDHCVAHPDGGPATAPNGEASYEGPDIAYCILEDSLAELADSLGNPPVIPPMMPTGCERNWLAHEVYETANHATVTAIGAGCSFYQEYWGQDCQDGVKRFAAEQLTEQLSYNGSSTKLRLRRDLWDEGTGVYSGDSGGPVLVRLPDNTWRLIGLLHGTSLDTAYAEAVPPYLHWIEQSSGIDITPFHEFNGSGWIVQSGSPQLPKYVPGESWGLWTNVCAAAPKGLSSSYNQPYVLEGFACSGWNLPPEDLTVQSVGEGSTHVLSGQRASALKVSSSTAPQSTGSSVLVGSQPMTAPLPYLPVQQTRITRSTVLQPLW